MDTLLNGRYRVVRKLGSGGMSTVYLAESLSLGTLWAIKAVSRAESRLDLLAEPNILKRLHHPALPRIVDIAQDDRFLYIIEDYVEGVSLDKQLGVQGRFDEATVTGWAEQLCDVLIYLHGQKPHPIIYRDLKPANLIVSADNRVQLIDFGIAREYKDGRKGDTAYMGTRGYAAPEQYGSGQTDARTDLYALGMTMYHLLTGKSPSDPPYAYGAVRKIDARLSEGIEYIIAKCVQTDPADRYQSAAEVLHDLQNIHVFNTAYRRGRRRERVKHAAMLALALCSAALIVVGGAVRLSEKQALFDRCIQDGYALVGQYRFDDAQRQLAEAEALRPQDPAPALGRAQITLRQGDPTGCLTALSALETALPAAARDPLFHYLRGAALLELQRYEEAAPALERAAGDDPATPAYARDLAICYARLGRADDARAVLQRPALQGEQHDAAALIEAQIAGQAGDTDAAVLGYRALADRAQSLEIRRRALLGLAGIYKDLRERDPGAVGKQIEALEAVCETSNGGADAAVVEALAEAYFAGGEPARAEALFQNLIDGGAAQPYLYRNIAIIRQTAGDYAGAADILAQMQAAFPEEYTCYLQLAYLTLETEGKKPQSARDYGAVPQYYEQAVRLAPDGAQTPALQSLAAQIEQLRAAGWLA